MKKLLLFSFAVLTASVTFAQTKMTGSDTRFGVKAGVNLARMHYTGGNVGGVNVNDNTKDNVGYNLTFFGDFGVGNNFFIQPGVSLQNKGTKTDGTIGGLTSTSRINVMAIEIPVNAVLRIPTGDAGAVQISAGPYVGFNIDGKTKTEVTAGGTTGKTETDLKFGSKSTDNLSDTDFGLNFGLGYRLNSGFIVGANYGLGLTNLVPKANRSSSNDGKFVNRVLGFTVGYSF